MKERASYLLALGCVLGNPALAQTLDYRDALTTTQPVSAAVSQVAAWVKTINVIELTVQYEEGKNLEFWIEKADLHASRADSVIRVFGVRPTLSTLFDLVLDTRRLSETTMTPSEALSDCHTCDAVSRKRLAAWAATSRDPQRRLSRALSDLEREMSILLRRAETAAAVAPPSHPKD